MFEPITIAIAISISLLLILFLRSTKPDNHYLIKLPGPDRGCLGNAVQFLSDRTKLLPQMLRWISSYGPTFKCHDGPFSSVALTTDCKFIEHILSSSRFIDKSDQYDWFKLWLGNAIFVAPIDQHKPRRRLLAPAFHHDNLEKHVEVFDSVSNALVVVMERCIEKGGNVDVYPFALLCTLDVICEASFGVKVNVLLDENSEYVQAVRAFLDAFITKMMSPLHPQLHRFTANHWRQKEAAKLLNSFAERIVREKYDRKTASREKQVMLDYLLQIKEDGGDITREYIRDEVNGLILGGFHTTSSALSFALYLISIHPGVQEKTFNEQVEIFEGRNLKTAKATIEDLNRMKYLELVIKETLRLYPSAPVLGRKLPEDLKWDGVLYPKDTVIGILVLGIHRDPKYFPDPEQFIPERFQTNLTGPYTYLPFSSGPRNCIGQRFAMLELKAVLSKLLRNFEVLPTDPRHEPQLIFEVILVSQNGIRICLKHRTFGK